MNSLKLDFSEEDTKLFLAEFNNILTNSSESEAINFLKRYSV